MKVIPLTQGYEAMVDDEDFEWLNQWKWCAVQSRYTFYAERAIYLGGGRKNPKLQKVKMHRLLMGDPEGELVDHKDGNGLNNQRSNLRMATIQQNNHNARRRKDNKSGFKGVTLMAGRWRARIRMNGIARSLGMFSTAEEASEAYDVAADELYGEFARKNGDMK